MTNGSGPLIDSQIASSPELIKDGSLESFGADVIEASADTPVLVDFWSPRSDGCRQLMATLEKLVQTAGGKIKVVKIDVEQNPGLAQQLRVQSVPTVFAFKNGQPVDGFAGVLPESQVRAFIEKQSGAIGPSPSDKLTAQGHGALEAGDLEQAEQCFGNALHQDPGKTAALAGLTKTYIAMGDLDRANQALQMVPPGTKDDAELSGARAALELAEQSANTDPGEIERLEAQISANPKDMEARAALSDAHLAAGNREAAVDTLLEMIQDDRGWNDEAARKKLVTLFEAFGPTDELTVSSRRRLSSILFS
jgi:putative thioredoxin